MNYSFEIIDFDSKLFGFKVASITHVNNGEAAKLIEELKRSEVSYATYRLPSDNFLLIHQLEREGFVMLDGVVDLSVNIDNVTIGAVENNIRQAGAKDITQLRKIAGEAFLLNRFYWDPVIPKDKAPIIYEQWIENSVLGKAADYVLISEVQGQITGFITLEKKGHIPLLAVSGEFQGKGLSRELLNAAFSKFQEWKVGKVTIATTLLNIQAIRSYLTAGFTIIGSRFTFRWASKDV